MLRECREVKQYDNELLRARNTLESLVGANCSGGRNFAALTTFQRVFEAPFEAFLLSR
jgi:hypothetical protein